MAALEKRAAFSLPLFHPGDYKGPPPDWPEDRVIPVQGNRKEDREENYRRHIEANP